MHRLRILAVAHDEGVLETLCSAVSADASLALSGRCRTGAEVLRLAADALPDVVALGLGGPDEEGFGLIGRLRDATGAKVVAMSPAADVALRALDEGADDFLYMPVGGSESDLQRFAEDAVDRLKAASISNAPKPDGSGETGCRLAVAACADGGPMPLAFLLKRLRKDGPAVLMLQKNAGIFTGDLAELLSRMSGRAVERAQDGMALAPGSAVLADGGRPARVEIDNGKIIIKLGKSKSGSPADRADVLFSSAAQELGNQAAGILLSGDGDGYEGLLRLAACGAPAVLRNKNALLREPGYRSAGGVAELSLEDIGAFMSRLVLQSQEPSSAATRS